MVQSPASFGRVTCLPPKNASAPWGGTGSRWLTIIVRQVSYIQYLLACQKSQRSTPYNIVKSALPWSRVFRRRHLGRRVTAVTCLRWPTVSILCPNITDFTVKHIKGRNKRMYVFPYVKFNLNSIYHLYPSKVIISWFIAYWNWIFPGHLILIALTSSCNYLLENKM